MKHREAIMIYPAPKQNDKEYVVPVVTKNKDTLVGFLQGFKSGLDVSEITLAACGVRMEFESWNDADNLDLSSKRFNDVVCDGVRESDMSALEKKEYFKKFIEQAHNTLQSKENYVDYLDVLRISCSCGMGFYSWKSISDIPTKNVKCDICGKYVIHYTEHDDWMFEFDEGEQNGNG